ncbi:MAG: hypothetical protein WC661_10275 [Opitutaceae bacterium]|jgi:hypothetical protein
MNTIKKIVVFIVPPLPLWVRAFCLMGHLLRRTLAVVILAAAFVLAPAAVAVVVALLMLAALGLYLFTRRA